MKISKKKLKKEEIIISEPQSLHHEQNGIDNAACITPTNLSNNQSRNLSKESGRTSRSSARSGEGNPSLGEVSEFDSDDDYSDFLSDEEGTNCSTSAPGDIEKQALKRPKKTLEPIVNSCCGFCSLGAGSLLTGLMYICFGIGYLVFRINDFNFHHDDKQQIITGADYYKDIWKLILITGMAVISISMVGALVLLIASCVFGQKEHYIKMRNAAIVWCVLTALAVLWNVGEGVYVILIPAEYDQKVGTTGIISNRLTYKEIKAHLTTVWAITGVYTLFYVYLVIVLVSYLRLLKYQGAPKVGGVDPTEIIKKTSRPGSQMNGSMRRTSSRPGREMNSRSHSRLQVSANPRTEDNDTQSERSIENRKISQSSMQAENNTYVNWSQLDQDSAIGPSPVHDTKPNEDEESLAASSVYDMPPGEIYDAYPSDKDNSELPPAPLPKDNINVDESIIYTNTPHFMEPLEADDLHEKANSILSLSNSVLKEMQNQQTQSEAGESAYSSPSSKPVKRDVTSSNRSDARLRNDEPPNPSNENNETAAEEPKVEPAVVSKFFKRLSSETVSENPLEEMFRLFGGDLCSQHPENCQRYLKSYKDVRSKTSHIDSLRDPFEFGKLDGSEMPTSSIQPPQQFALNPEEMYSANNSVYSQNAAVPFLQPPSRHFSSTLQKPQPVHDYRPRSRDERNSYDTRASFDPRAVPFRDPRDVNGFMKSKMQMQTLPHFRRFSDNRSIYSAYSGAYNPYSDDTCSTCYGDLYSMYGDYSDLYSFSGYYPQPLQPQQRRPPPMPHFTQESMPTRRQPSRMSSTYNPSTSSRFNSQQTMPRRISKQSSSNSNWIAVNAEDDYSVYGPPQNNFRSRSLSMPNLAEPDEPERAPSVASTDTAFSKLLSPEFTLPSPRETNKLSRSSSWSSFRHQSTHPSNDSRGFGITRKPSHTDSNAALRNYSGYHTGDLRRRTSHTFHPDDDQLEDRNSLRSRIQSRNTNRSARQGRQWNGDAVSDMSRNPSVTFKPGSGRGRTVSRSRTPETFSHTPSRVSRTNSEMRSERFSRNSGINSRLTSYPSQTSRRSGISSNYRPSRDRIISNHSQVKPSFRSGSEHFRQNFEMSSRQSQMPSEFSHSSRPSRTPSRTHDSYRGDRNFSASRNRSFRDNRSMSAPRRESFRRDSSVEDSRASYRQSSDQSRNALRRTRSVRYNEQTHAQPSSKQVKFGSTPDLRRI